MKTLTTVGIGALALGTLAFAQMTMNGQTGMGQNQTMMAGGNMGGMNHNMMGGGMMGGMSGMSQMMGGMNAGNIDRNFLTMMIPHHQQALVMSDLVPARSQDAELSALARSIVDTQQPEITQMQGYLAQWGVEELPSDAHAGHAMPGMMTAEQMKHLASLRGDAFDAEWVRMMIAHHEGAVGMAKDVLAEGRHGPTRDLARHVIEAQQQEIDQMRAMLSR